MHGVWTCSLSGTRKGILSGHPAKEGAAQEQVHLQYNPERVDQTTYLIKSCPMQMCQLVKVLYEPSVGGTKEEFIEYVPIYVDFRGQGAGHGASPHPSCRMPATPGWWGR